LAACSGIPQKSGREVSASSSFIRSFLAATSKTVRQLAELILQLFDLLLYLCHLYKNYYNANLPNISPKIKKAPKK